VPLIYISKGCNQIKLLNNRIIGSQNIPSLHGSKDLALIHINQFAATAIDSDIFISGNLIRNGFCGITTYGTIKRISITNNIIDSFTAEGIYIESGDSVHVLGNNIKNSVGYDGIGMYIGATRAEVYRNKIYMPQCRAGMEINSSTTINIANNFITAGGDTCVASVALYGGDFISFIYNNVVMLSGDTTFCSGINAALTWSYSTPKSVVITNNNFVNAAGGRVVLGYPSLGATYLYPYPYPTYCDYNNFYTSVPDRGFNQFNYLGGCNYHSNIAGYYASTGLDPHSLLLDPGYKSNTDLHISNIKLYGRGNPLGYYYCNYISTDIDGNKRPLNKATIGAVELPDSTPHVFCSIGAPFLNISSVVCLGQPTQFADSSKVVNCGKISRQWNFNDGTPIDTSANPVHVCNWFGYRNIVLHVYTSGGCADSAVYQVFSDSTCTWPGDVDRNKKVDINDVLKLATLIGKTGNKRQKATIKWNAQFCYDWPYFYVNGISDNYKQFDCNGDGVIDSLDLNAISVNFSKSHAKTDAIATGDSTLDRRLRFVFSKPGYKAGDTLKADIVLDGYKDSVLNFMSGLGAVYSYNPEYLDSNSFNLKFTKSWLDTIGPRMIGFVHSDFSSGILAFVNTRIDYSQKKGQGKIGEISFMIPKSAKTGYLKFTGIQSAIENGPQYLAFLPSDSIKIVSNSGIEENTPAGNFYHIYPNPSHNSINIVSTQNEIFSYSLTDINGKLLVSGIINHNGKLDLSPYPPAVYVLKICSRNDVFISRIEKY